MKHKLIFFAIKAFVVCSVATLLSLFLCWLSWTPRLAVCIGVFLLGVWWSARKHQYAEIKIIVFALGVIFALLLGISPTVHNWLAEEIHVKSPDDIKGTLAVIYTVIALSGAAGVGLKMFLDIFVRPGIELRGRRQL